MQPATRQKLKQLVEIYAFRTRRTSEAIAVLGRHLTTERQIDEIVAEIKNLSRLVERAAADLFAFVGLRPEESSNEARDREFANLRGILQICMQCKKIRQADGDWVQLEQYIRDHSSADFSHGICPECDDAYRQAVRSD